MCCELARQCEIGQSIVPSILVRPYALNDKAATGEYKILKPKTIHFAKPLSRADLAPRLVSITENNNFLNKTVHAVGWYLENKCWKIIQMLESIKKVQ